MPKSLKRSRGWTNLYNPNSSNQVPHTKKTVRFSNGKSTNYNNNLSKVPRSRISQTSVKIPGAYQVPPTGVVNIDPHVNRRPIIVNKSSATSTNGENDENPPNVQNRSLNNLARELEGLEIEGGSRRKTRKQRKQRKQHRKSRARKTRRAF